MSISATRDPCQAGTASDNAPCDTHRAAVLVGLAEQTLRKLRIVGGGPPFIKIGKAVRYRPSDLDAWLTARMMSTTTASYPANREQFL